VIAMPVTLTPDLSQFLAHCKANGLGELHVCAVLGSVGENKDGFANLSDAYKLADEIAVKLVRARERFCTRAGWK
jgi:hypothetical protein